MASAWVGKPNLDVSGLTAGNQVWCRGGGCQRKHLSWLIMNTPQLPSLWWEATTKDFTNLGQTLDWDKMLGRKMKRENSFARVETVWLSAVGS